MRGLLIQILIISIEHGADAGAWLPLASTLRKCRYAGRDSDALDRSNVKRMLIDGKVQAAININDFGLYFAPQCQEPVVQDFGVEYLNTFVAPVYKTGRPGIDPEPADVDAILQATKIGVNTCQDVHIRVISTTY